MEINVREYRRGNLRWEIQRKRTIEGTQDTDKQNKNTSQMCWTPSCTSKHSILMYIDNNTNIKIRIRWYISHSNITSFFRFVNKRAIYRLGIISLAHAPGHVTDIPVVNVHVDELSSARNWQHKLCATLSSNVIINYRLPIWFKHILFAN
jgi:hypothetical protein